MQYERFTFQIVGTHIQASEQDVYVPCTQDTTLVDAALFMFEHKALLRLTYGCFVT